MSYKQGWRALNRLLHEDRSFSGHERNCAFLNTGGDSPRFADVSAVTAFDFADDARGLATVDWDFDGDLDVWITNRTAPRLRLLKNNSRASERFVSVKLEGDGIQCNRDAIGARLELHIASAAPAVRIRTLRAGEGFLSQSSNWIHFGLPPQATIEKLVVRWPGSTPEEFPNLSPGKFYLLKQSGQEAVAFDPPAQRIQIAPSDQPPTPMVETVRIVVPSGLPIPDVTVTDSDTPVRSLQLHDNKATLLNLWSSTCAVCLSELAEWSEHADKLAAAGVEIISLNTDHLAGAIQPADTLAVLTKTGSTFTNHSISASGVQSLDDLQRAVLDRWIPLPVPSSFLVAPSGELVAIYKGAVSVEQLIADIPLAEADAAARRDAAISFPGKWVGEPSPADPKRVSSMMLDHNRPEAAQAYLAKCTRYFEALPSSDSPDGKRNLGDLYYQAGLLSSADPATNHQGVVALTRARELIPDDLRVRLELGRQLLDLGRPKDALPELRAASEIDPADLGLRQDIGLIHFKLGDYQQARAALAPVVAAEPNNGLANFHLANTEVRLGDIPKAISRYRKTLEIAPELFDAANNLAWILSSHPDPELRSPRQALALTQRLCSLTKNNNPRYLDSLSVALANSGDFEAAIAAADRAISIYGNDNQRARAAVAARVQLYRAGMPYREEIWR
ncbi:MAG: tetratricopeptide repeat protein [Verrucomicrobiales bacterium]